MNGVLELLLFMIPAAGILLTLLPWTKAREIAAFLATLFVALVLIVFKSGAWITAKGVWLEINQFDRLSLVVLMIITIVGLTSVVYASGYLNLSADKYQLTNRKHMRFFLLIMLFYFFLLWTPIVHNVILLWVCIEGTSLASVFLVDYENTTGTFEATWKYLIMMEIGGGLALAGTVIILMGRPAGLGSSLSWQALMTAGHSIPPLNLKLGFALIVAGYGIKAGLVPLHSWLPDAHSMAPSPVSAMLSGIKINIALYGILRFYDILSANGQISFAAFLLRWTGILTVLVAIAMTGVQKDFKRLFAYSSIENMGLIAFGYTLGTFGVYGALLQMLNHALIKPGLFFLSGNLLIQYQSTEIRKARGILFQMKWSGLLLVLLMLAIAGAPPFGLFLSEFIIILSALHEGLIWMAVVLVILLAILFANFLRYALKMVFGRPNTPIVGKARFTWRTVFPPLLHLIGSLVMGTAIPMVLQQLLYMGK